MITIIKWKRIDKKSDAVEFAEWLRANAQPVTQNDYEWVLNKDNREFRQRYTIEELYEIFKKETK